MKCFIKYLFFFLVASLAIQSCEEITDFGYNGILKGTVTNQGGDKVSGNLTGSDLVVRIQGEFDKATMYMRVKGEGTFQNTKLYPQSYSVWLEGAFVESPTPEVEIDLTGNKEAIHNFVITPYIDCSAPVLVGSPAASNITINYNFSGNSGFIPDICVIYCSTVMFPSAQTGSGAGYTTLIKTISNTAKVIALEGSVEFTNLTSGTKYYIRVGSRAKGQSSYNYSDQISVSIP